MRIYNAIFVNLGNLDNNLALSAIGSPTLVLLLLLRKTVAEIDGQIFLR